MAQRKVKASQIVNRTGGVDTDDGRTLYGFDAEVYLRMKAKEDPEFEKKIGLWIEGVLEPEKLLDVNDLFTSLKDGLALCQIMNKLKPGLIPKFSTKRDRNGKLHPLMERENINLYLEACWKVGVTSDNMFIVADLHGRRGMGAVFQNLYSLSNLAAMWGLPVEPVRAAGQRGTAPMVAPDLKQKKPSKWNVELGETIYTGEAVEDEVEAMEDELLSLKQQLEESQRTVSRLEESKRNLNEQLKVERRKYVESEKEVSFLRSRPGGAAGAAGGASHPFIEELKKSRDDLQKAYDGLKEQSGGAALDKLQKELEQIKAQKQALQAKLGAIDSSEIEKLKARIVTLQSQLAEGAGGDALLRLQQERDSTVTSLERRVAELTSIITGLEEEQSNLRTKLEETEESKETDNRENQERRVAAEDALRQAKQASSRELTKLQGEIAELTLAKDLAVKQLETAKANYDSQLESEKTKWQDKIAQQKEEISKLKAAKEALAKEQEAKRNSIKEELEAVKAQYEKQVAAYKKEISELQKDKAAINEKLYEETRRLQQELFAQGAAKHDVPASSGDFAREKAYLEEQHKIEIDKITQEKISSVDSLERQLLDEKRRGEQLAADIKRIEVTLLAELKAEKEKAEVEMMDMLAALEDLEKEKEAMMSQKSPAGDLDEKMAELSAQVQQEKLKLENKVREMEKEKLAVEEDRDILKAQLEAEIVTLKAKSLNENQKHKAQIAALERSKNQLSESLKLAEEKNKEGGGDQFKKFSDELNLLRGSFDLAVRALSGGDPNVTLANLGGGEWKDKCTALEAKEAKYLEEISRLTAELKEFQEAQLSVDAVVAGFKQKIEVSEKIFIQQTKMIQRLEKDLKEAKAAGGGAGAAPARAAPASGGQPPAPGPAPSPPTEKAAAPPAKTKAEKRAQRQTVRLYTEKGTVEMDIERLKLVVEKIMVGDPVTLDECLSFKNLFKLDNGRRVLCFLLKEYSELAAEGEPFLISFSSFEMLRELITLVLQYLNLTDGADFISGRLLLECSSLIARESKKGGDVEFIQTLIKPHRCWRNTYFWDEYFWVQLSPKFEEITLETTEQEHAFFSVEIVEFAKRMWGWGNLSSQSIVLFVETIARKAELNPSEVNTLVRMTEDYCAQQLNPTPKSSTTTAKKAKPKDNNAKLFVNRRTTVAFSANQLQQELQNQKLGHGFESFSDGFDKADKPTPPTANFKAASPSTPGRERGSQKGHELPMPAGRGRGVGRTTGVPGPAPASPMTASSDSASKTRSASVAVHTMSKRKMMAKTINLNSASQAFVSDLLKSQAMDF